VWEDELVTAGVPGMVGLAGIVGTFFAPTWAQRSIAQRSEKREFRRAQRLVAEELQTIVGHLEFLSKEGRVPTINKEHKRLGGIPPRPCDVALRSRLGRVANGDAEHGTAPKAHHRGGSWRDLSADALQYIALSIRAARAACERLKKAEPLTDWSRLASAERLDLQEAGIGRALLLDRHNVGTRRSAIVARVARTKGCDPQQMGVVSRLAE
jgi:hypothetical protein